MPSEPMTREDCLQHAVFWQRYAAMAYERIENLRGLSFFPAGAIISAMNAHRVRAGTAMDYFDMAAMIDEHSDFVARLSAQLEAFTEATQERILRFESALHDIATQDEIELMLDPQWAKRTALAALEESAS